MMLTIAVCKLVTCTTISIGLQSYYS